MVKAMKVICSSINSTDRKQTSLVKYMGRFYIRIQRTDQYGKLLKPKWLVTHNATIRGVQRLEKAFISKR